MGGIKTPAIEASFAHGLSFMQAHFPGRVFPKGAMHELLCHQPEHMAATGGFVSALLATLFKTQGAIIWISPVANVFPPALKRFNINPEQVIFIHPKTTTQTLWVVEEALKCRGLKAVVAEVNGVSFTHSRRLQLAVENSNVTGFLLNYQKGNPATNACVSRWQVTTAPSQKIIGLPGIGFPTWKVELQKMRSGKKGDWMVEWNGSNLQQANETTVHHQFDLIKQAV